MSQKNIKYTNYMMNFNFVFISYSVIYAKYNHCYEVSREQPLRYFDGKEWKLIRPRANIRTKAPRNSSISVDLDWAEVIKEMKEFELEETATELPKSSVFISDTITATKKTTHERLNTKKYTTKRETTKKLTFKKANTKTITYNTATTKKYTNKIATSPKISIKRRTSQSSTTARPFLIRCRPLCKPKVKSATTTTVDPRLLPLEMTTSGDWRDNWNLMRPTKKHSPVTAKKLALKATNVFDLQMIKKVPVTTTRKSTTTTTRKPTTTTKKPVTSTKKPTAQTVGTVAGIKIPGITTDMPKKYVGCQENEANSPANWSNLMKEFLKFVESKKCQPPPCEPVTATNTKPYLGYQFAENEDDLMNILMDGVEIDERLDEEDEDATRIKDTLDFERRRFNYDSVGGSFSEYSEMGNDYEQDLDFDSLKDSIETRRDTTQFPKKMGYLQQNQAENEQKVSLTSHIREPNLYFDTLKDNDSNGDDDFLENEIKSHSDELEANFAEKANLTSQIRESEAGSDELKDYQNIEKKAYLDALKDMRANKNYIFSGIRGTEALKNSQNSEAKSYFDTLRETHTTKRYFFSGIRQPKMYLPQDKIKDKIAQKEDDVREASDIKFHSDSIMGKIDEKDYGTSRTRKTEININELSVQEDKVIDDSEIKFYINVLKNKHAKKEKDPSVVVGKEKQYVGEKSVGQQDKVNLQDESTEIFNSKELNKITDYIASKPTYPIKVRSQTNNIDGSQDSNISFD